MKLKWLIFALVLVSLLIFPVSALTLTGDIGGSVFNQTTYSWGYTGSGGTNYYMKQMTASYVENLENLESVVLEQSTIPDSLDAGAPVGLVIPMSMHIDATNGAILGNGSIQYQRRFTSGGTEIPGYIAITFLNFSTQGYTGSHALFLEFNETAFYHYSYTAGQQTGITGDKIMWNIYAGYCAGTYSVNKRAVALNSYSATKPSGLGIEGYVFKHASGDSKIYPTKAFIFNGLDGSIITNDYVLSSGFLYFNILSQPIIIGVQDSVGNIYNSSVLFLPNATPTPTITPLPNASPYALTLVPQAIPIGGNVSAELHSSTDPAFSHITGIQYYYADDNSASNEFFDPGSVTLVKEYTLIGGTWKQYDHATNDYTNTVAGLPNPVDLQFKGLAGTKEVSCWVTLDSGQSYRLTGMVYVGQGQNYVNTRVQAVNGLDGGIVYNPEIDILNQNTGAWTNSTYANGQASISTAANTQLSFYGKLIGYADAQLLNKPARSDVIYGLQFFPGTNPSAGNQTFTILVTEDNLNLNNAIPGALIKLTGNGGTLTGTSSQSGGSYQFTLKTATTYSYAISKTGYKSSSGSFTTTAATSDYRVFTLQKGSNVVTTVPTGVITVPTTLSNGSAGNYTGFWSPFYKGFAGMGATAAELGLIMTMCAILFGLIVMAVVTKGQSPQAISIGGSFGLIFASMIGWVSIWLVAAGVAWAMMSIFTFRNNSG